MAHSQCNPDTTTSTGSHSLTTFRVTGLFCHSRTNLVHLQRSSSSRHLLRTSWAALSRLCAMIKEGNTCLVTGSRSVLLMESRDNTLSELNHTRMVLLSVQTGHSWSLLSACSMNPSSLARSGGMQLLHSLMCTTGLPLRPLHLARLHLSSGTSNNLLLLIFAFLAVLPMSTSRRTSDSNWLPTHRSVYSSATLLITRPGCSGTQ